MPFGHKPLGAFVICVLVMNFNNLHLICMNFNKQKMDWLFKKPKIKLEISEPFFFFIGKENRDSDTFDNKFMDPTTSLESFDSGNIIKVMSQLIAVLFLLYVYGRMQWIIKWDNYWHTKRKRRKMLSNFEVVRVLWEIFVRLILYFENEGRSISLANQN